MAIEGMFMDNISYPKALPVLYMISGTSFRRRWGELLCLVLCIIVGLPSQSKAQQLKLGVNPTRINKAAVLELESGNQGLLLTRVDTLAVNLVIEELSASQRDSTNGMIIFQVSDSSLYLRKGGYWKKLVLADQTGIVSLNNDSSKEQSLKLVNGTTHYAAPTLIDSVSGGHYLFLPYASKGTIGLVDNDYQQWYGTKVIRDALGLSYLSPGSIPFIGNDADHTLSQDAARLYWDPTKHWLGIGTNNPTNTLEITSGITNSSGLTLSNLKASDVIDNNAGLIGVTEGGKVVRAGVKRTMQSVTRNIDQSYQISPTQDAFVTYTVTLSFRLKLGGLNALVNLQISPDGTTWTTISSVQYSNSIINLLNLADVVDSRTISGWVPANYYVRINTSASGITITPSVSGQEMTVD
jgi:hypothetical protein